MTISAHYFSPTTPTAASFDEDVSSSIRLGSISGLAGEAQGGSVGTGSIVLDDPGSTVGHLGDGILGLKQFYINETACPAGNQRMWTGYIWDRRYRRGTGESTSLRLSSDREIDITLQDLNAFLSFRVFAPTADDPTSDFVRPAETDLERVQALLTTVDFISTTLFDIGYIPATGGVNMSAEDYTGRRPIDVLNDCMQVSKRNFHVLYDETGNQLVLWYDDWKTDGTTTLVYDSALRLTNVASEADQSTTFAIAPDAVEVLDPARVVSAAYGQGTGVTGYRTLASTANTYAWRDMDNMSTFVKDQTKLNALLDSYLIDNATEQARITCTVRVPAASVTAIHEGMRIQAHFTHLPRVSDDFTWCRIMSRTIRQDQKTEQFYWLDLELDPIPIGVVPQAYMCGANTNLVETEATPVPVYWEIAGGDCGEPPLIGLIEQLGTAPFYTGWRILGTGIISFHAEARSVPGPCGAGTNRTFRALLNGTIEVGSVTYSTNPVSPADIWSFDVENLPVVPGDEITFSWNSEAGCPRGVFNNAAVGPTYISGGFLS